MEGKRTWWIFGGCCVIGLLFVGMICNTAGLYFQNMAEELNQPMTKVTLTMSFLNAGGLLGTFLAGRISIEKNVRLVSGLAAAATGGGFLLAAFCHSLAGFYLLWLTVGICTPLLVTITIPTVLGKCFSEKLGMTIGIVYGLSGIGGSLFNVLMGQVIAAWGWRTALGLEGVLALLGILPFPLFVFGNLPGSSPKPPGAQPEVFQRAKNGQSQYGVPYQQARKMQSFYLYIAAGMALTIVSSLLQQVSPHIGALGYDITVSARVMSALMLGCAAGNVLLGSLLDRFPTVPVIRLYALFGLAGWLGIGMAKDSILLMISAVPAGLAQAVFQTGLPFCYRQTYGGLEFPKISAALALPSSLLAVVSASFGGIIYDLTGSYLPVMLLLSGMFLAAEPCMISAVKKRKDENTR